MDKDDYINKFANGEGFFSSEWIAAIDDQGERLILHNSKATKVQPNGDLHSEIHVFCGPKYEDHKLIQLGHVIEDEIIEIIFDYDKSEAEEKEDKESQPKQQAQPTAFASPRGSETVRDIL